VPEILPLLLLGSVAVSLPAVNQNVVRKIFPLAPAFVGICNIYYSLMILLDLGRPAKLGFAIVPASCFATGPGRYGKVLVSKASAWS